MNQCGFDQERFDAAVKEFNVKLSATIAPLMKARQQIEDAARQLGVAWLRWLETPEGKQFQKALGRLRTR